MFGPAEEAVVTALLDGTADAPPVKILKCNDENCYDVREQTLSVPASSALRPRIATMIRSMSDKIRSDTPLDAAEKQLLNLATVPIYKILGSSDEHTSELQALLPISYSFFCIKK